MSPIEYDDLYFPLWNWHKRALSMLNTANDDVSPTGSLKDIKGSFMDVLPEKFRYSNMGILTENHTSKLIKGNIRYIFPPELKTEEQFKAEFDRIYKEICITYKKSQVEKDFKND